MDVEIAIRYSDDRPCMVTIAKPGSGEPLYRILTPQLGIPQSLAEGLREVRRLFEGDPWGDTKPHRGWDAERQFQLNAYAFSFPVPWLAGGSSPYRPPGK